MDMERYEEAAKVQREANNLAQVALAPYWEGIAEAVRDCEGDMGAAVEEVALCIEDDGRLTLAIGGPGVWLLPTGELCGAWWGPRIYSEAPNAATEDAARAILDYVEEVRELCG